jgi:photosystem II stability/assembly factor-like uncharacterized protein
LGALVNGRRYTAAKFIPNKVVSRLTTQNKSATAVYAGNAGCYHYEKIPLFHPLAMEHAMRTCVKPLKLSLAGIAVMIAGCTTISSPVTDLAPAPVRAVASTPCFGPSPASDETVAKKHGITAEGVAKLRYYRDYDDDRFCRVATATVKRHLGNLGKTKLARALAHPSREYLLNLQRGDDGKVAAEGYRNALDARAAMVMAQRAQPKLGGLNTRNWIALGPYDVAGRIKAILIDPDNPRQVWVGAATGGIWRTTDGGDSWVPIDDFFASPAIQTLAMDSQNRNVIYAGTGESASGTLGSGIMKSTDRGQTWTFLPGTRDIQYVNRLVTHPSQSNIVIAATETKVIRSIDGGANWTDVLVRPPESFVTYMDIEFDPNNPNNVMVGTNGGQAMVSRNGGVTWAGKQVAPLPTMEGGLFPGRVEIEYARSQPGRVYASVDQEQGQVFRSNDNGETWALVSTPKHLQTQGNYGNTIWVAPDNANLVMVGGIDVYRSTDGGANFVKVADWSKWPQSAHADHHYLVAHPGYNGTTNREAWLGTDGGLYRISDVTTVAIETGWVTRNSNLQVTQFYHAAGRRDLVRGQLFGGTQDNGTPAVLGNAPRTWSVVVGGDGGFAAPDYTNPDRFYGTLQNGGLFRQDTTNPTLNRGNTYICEGITEVYPFFCGQTNVQRTLFITPIANDPRAPNRLYVGSNSLWASDDPGGEFPTWRAIKPPLRGADGQALNDYISAIGIAPSDSNIVYIGHTNGRLFRTSNALGATPTFAELTAPGQRFIRRLIVDAQNPQKLYATLGGYQADNIQVSVDGGQTWRSISGNLPAAPVHSVAVSPMNPRVLYVGTQVGVFASEDEGATWSASNEGPGTVPVFHVFFYDNIHLIATSFGRGLWTIDTTGTDPSTDSDNDGMSNRVEALEGRNPRAKDNDIFGNPRLFVMQMYRDFLTREGDEGGVGFWVGRINRGERSRAQMAEEYVNSNEFQGRIAPVVRAGFAIDRAIPAFAATFQRVAARDAGRSIEQIGQDIYNASPRAATYNAQSEAAFVAGIYNDLLGRAPNASEQAAAGPVIASVGRGGFIVRVTNTDEYARRSYNQVYVTMMYMGMLRRAPEQGGFDFWVGVMNGGQSGLGLVQAFLDAPEYRGRFL